MTATCKNNRTPPHQKLKRNKGDKKSPEGKNQTNKQNQITYNLHEPNQDDSNLQKQPHSTSPTTTLIRKTSAYTA
uniref:Uncharacterized protein n=1 Tax=Nelumbo nucifera TaxID=4432 RepID=A0A822YI90_NELNU|nr:TPA_asm: hypothetical protein HUJ06_011043 [Nelumbo nucifera]